MRLKTVIHSAFLLFILLSCKSENFQNNEIFLKLPEWPPEKSYGINYPALQEWKISINYGFASSSFNLPALVPGFYLPVYSNEPVSILAWPITDGISFFEASGMIFPYSQSFDWQEGFTALILHKFYLSQKENKEIEKWCQKVNWQKMSESLNEKSKKSPIFYNPFLLDQENILSALINKELSASLFNLKKTSSVPISAFRENKNFDYLSSYIPQNLAIKLNSCVSMKENWNSNFLCLSEPKEIVTASIDSSEILSLTYNLLPIK